MNCEYQAIYRDGSGLTVAFPLVRDAGRAYRLCCEGNSLVPIRHWLNDRDLEFVDFQLADDSHGGDAEKFMRMILTRPAIKPRPAEERSTRREHVNRKIYVQS
jgi:hypothetical protein